MNTVTTCFPGGKNKCLTMSYDDGVWQDKRLIQDFRQLWHQRHVSPELGNVWQARALPQARGSVYATYQGHEVSCHTATHPAIDHCPLPAVALEVLEDRKTLEGIFGYPVRGMSYPFGSHTAEIRQMLPSLGVFYSRIVGDSFNFDMPTDFLQWKATCHHNHRLMEMAEVFNGFRSRLSPASFLRMGAQLRV